MVTLPNPTIDLVTPATVPVNVGLSNGAFNPIAVATDVAKFASFPNAVASSFSVFNALGALSTRLLTAVDTNAVVAICVVLVPTIAVVATGVPVNVGLVNIVAFDSLVTLPNPTCVAVTPVTIPVNTGLVNNVDFDSLVTLPSPTIAAVIPLTVPLNVALVSAGLVNIVAFDSLVTLPNPTLFLLIVNQVGSLYDPVV